MEEVEKMIQTFNNAFDMLNRDIIQTTITTKQVLEIEQLIKSYKEQEYKAFKYDCLVKKIEEEILECKKEIPYWQKQYEVAKTQNNEFYIHSQKRQFDMWQARLETLQRLLKEMDKYNEYG